MIRTFSNSAANVARAAPSGRQEPFVLTLEGLARARNGETVLIDGVDDSATAPGLRRRLLETGFTAGCPVRFVLATPFGDPLVFSLRGTTIALRQSEARCVRVRPGAAS